MLTTPQSVQKRFGLVLIYPIKFKNVKLQKMCNKTALDAAVKLVEPLQLCPANAKHGLL